jgi:uncharacterized protein involved in outer membrane biogenesis
MSARFDRQRRKNMRKWVIAGGALLALCAVVLVAILNINSVIDRNRAYLLARAEEALGRKISAGDIHLALWGGVGLRVKDFAMSDDPTFSTGDFVRAREAQVHVKLLPIFRGKFEVKNVVLHDPVISILRNPAGDFNFASIGDREKKEKRERTERKEEKGERSGDLRIALADISNGELIYRDEKERVRLNLKQIDLRVKDGGPEKPASVRLEAAAFGDKRNLRLETKIGPLQGSDWRQVPVDGEISFNPLDLTRLQAAVPAIRAVFPKEMAAAGSLILQEIRLKGTLNSLSFSGKADATAAAIALATAFRKPSGIPLEVIADGHYGGDTVRIRKADVKLHRIEATAQGEISFGAVPAVSLTLDSKRSALTGLDQVFPVLEGYQLAGDVETHARVRGKIGKGSAPNVEGNVTLSGVSGTPPQLPQPVKDLNAQVTFSGPRASVRDGSVTVGATRIGWSGTVESFAPFKLSYDLAAPELRPADFQQSTSEARANDVLKNFTSKGHLTMQGGGLALEAKIASSDGGLFNVPYQRLESGVAFADKVVTVRGLRVNALQGALLGDGEYALGETPRFAATSKIQGIDLNEGYRAFGAQAARDIRGRLNADVKLAGTGRDWDEIKTKLRGQGEAEVVDGALLDFNLADAALSATGIPAMKNIISPQVRKKYPETFESKDTKFKQLKARFNAADGRVHVKDLIVVAADYSVQGDGWVDFDRRLEFRSSLMLSQRLSADLAQSVREAKFLFNEQNEFQMPFMVSGTLPNVKTRPDANYLARALQRGFVGQGVEQLERRLFGRKDSATEKKDEPMGDDPKKRKKRDAEDLIRRGLENLFRRN